jgi:ATP-dependent helicase YprA (DUF1998 family)
VASIINKYASPIDDNPGVQDYSKASGPMQLGSKSMPIEGSKNSKSQTTTSNEPIRTLDTFFKNARDNTSTKNNNNYASNTKIADSKNLQGTLLKKGVINKKETVEEEDYYDNLDEIDRILQESKIQSNPNKKEEAMEDLNSHWQGNNEIAPEFNTIETLKKVKRNWIIPNAIEWTTKKFPWDEEIDLVRKEVFGIQNYRQNQRAIINAAKSGRDVFVCMPTGGGKSLTFQLPAITDKGITLVVMPLLSLIYDQVSQIKSLGIQAACLTGRLKTKVKVIRIKKL